MLAAPKAVAPWLTLWCFTACSSHPASDERNAPMAENTLVKKAVTLGSDLPKRLVLGEEWPLTVTLRNASKERVTVSLRKDVRSDVTIRVWSTTGHRVTPTEFGEQHLPEEPWDSVISAELKHLKPGDSHSWKFEFHKCFDLEPGKYTVEMSVPVEPVGTVRQEADITVLPTRKSPGS